MITACHEMSRRMGKPAIYIGKIKAQISFTVTAKLISAFVFATWIVKYLFFLNPKFQASCHLLCLYSLVCVGPGRNPNCWFSHSQAQILEPGNNGHKNTWMMLAKYGQTFGAIAHINFILLKKLNK